MALPSSGPISLTDIQTEWGGSTPISLSEYYAGGSYVYPGETGSGGPIPSSGTIDFADFYGSEKQTSPTPWDYFTTAASIDTGSDWWVNPNNVLSSPSYATVSSYYTVSDTLRVKTPKSAALIPNGCTVTNIAIRIYCYRVQVNSGCSIQNVGIEGGTDLGELFVNYATPTYLTLSGNPSSYWGLSGAQLTNFLNGSIGFDMNWDGDEGLYLTIRVERIEAQFSFTYP